MGSCEFFGTEQLSLDAKGRVTMPARYREELQALCGGRLTLTKHKDGCVQILPEPVWQSFVEKLRDPTVDAQWRRFYMGSMAPVELDSGGRVMVSQALRDFAGLNKNVSMIGTGEKFELWDASRHAAHETKLLETPPPAVIANF